MVDFSLKYNLKKLFLSLRTLIPLSVFFVFLIVAGVSLLLSIKQSTNNLREQSLEYLRLNIATIARLADRTIIKDPQTLEDSVTQLSTNPLVKNIAVIKPHGEILFASNFSWRGTMANQSLPNFRVEQLTQTKKTRKVVINYIEEKQVFVAMMSFAYQSDEPSLRNLNKGIIYLSYDISDALNQFHYTAIYQRIPEVIAMLVLVILLMVILHRYVIKPINSIKKATVDAAQGDFNTKIDLVGPIEIQQLAKTFNMMNEKISSNIHELDNSSRKIKGILDNTFDGIITINESGTVLSFNLMAEKIFMIEANDIIGKNVKTLMPHDYKVKHDQYIRNYTNGNKAQIIGIGREVQGQRSDGSVFPMELAITEIISDDLRMFIGIVRDITVQKEKEKEVTAIQENLTKANAQLEELIRTDGLTNIANRRSFDETIIAELNRAIRQESNLSLLMFDVDFFKKYNDHYGHVAGDKCLIELAKATKKLFQRSGELVARYGGEEFAVILPNSTSEYAIKLANMLLKKIEDLKIVHEESLSSEFVSISIGVVTMQPTIQHTVKDLIQAADSALYEAKENGRGQAATFEA